MVFETLYLFISLLLILLGAEVFTNGVECLGRRLSLSQAVVGSLLAAVGTALPETILPFVAIFLHSGEASNRIGVGAILGAPFMLATLAFFLVGFTVLVSFLIKKRPFQISIEYKSMRRDIIFFLIFYSCAIFLPMFIQNSNLFIAIALVIGYVYYVYKTFSGESEGILHAEELYLKKIYYKARGSLSSECIVKTSTGLPLILSQVFLALVIMISGAHVFVDALSKISTSWGIDPLLFALLVAPVATELPEKFNSVTWTIKGRDPLALGNITGAMVFQSTFPVSLGLLSTEWNITGLALVSAIMAISISIIILINLLITKRLSPLILLIGAVFYITYTVLIIINQRT